MGNLCKGPAPANTTSEKYKESSSSSNNGDGEPTASLSNSTSGMANELENTKQKHNHSTPRQNLKAALIPHVKIHRDQHITDLYDLTEEKLGEGMTGAVVKAKVKSSGQAVAVKNVRKNLVRDVKALLKEIALLAQCDHPNIVRIIGSAEDKHNVYMALEVCTGGALLDTLMNNAAHHFTETEVGHMAVMMFRAIDYCHSHGIAHRDLKLDNWLFEKENGELKLIDFGLSKKFYSGDYDHHGMLRMTSFLGTPGFVAPEMQQTHFGERAEYTDMVDIWSLGVIIFALLSGRMPFKRKPSDCVPLEDKESRAYRRSFNKTPWEQISTSCKEFVEQLLDPNPDSRLSAEEALKHPFLIKHAKSLKQKRESMVESSGNRLSLKKQESVALTRMTQFARTDALQKAAMMLIAHELHQDEIDELRTIFYRLDTDNDGEITWREMKAGFLELNATPPEAVHQLFEAFVEDAADGEFEDDEIIPYSYFLAATMDHHVLRNIDRLREAFHAFDPDDTGMVDLHKVMELLDDHKQKKHGSDTTIVKQHITRGRSENKCEDTRHVTFDEFVAALDAFQKTSTSNFETSLENHPEKDTHRKKFINQKSLRTQSTTSGIDDSDANVVPVNSKNVSAELASN